LNNKSVIIDAVRSPIGIKNGNLIGVRPDDLAAQVIKGLLARNLEVKPEKIEDVVVGCAFPEGPQGMIIGRSVGVLAGLPIETAGKVVNRFCGSSMDALHQLSTSIESGDIDVGLAVGVEDMFSVPMGGFAPDFHPELAEQEFYIGMGEQQKSCKRWKYFPKDQEEFSIQSHQKSLKASAEGKFDNELIPIDVYGETTVEKDEGPREPDMEKIKNLKPAFIENGTITAATSSPISIGASAILITSGDFAEKNKLKVRAKVVSRAVAGVEWTHMGKGPLPATKKALKKLSLH
jgi:acetyl-CoA acyltransferase